MYALYESKAQRGWRNRVAILEAHELNSVLPAFTRQQSSHNFIHLAAESTNFRRGSSAGAP